MKPTSNIDLEFSFKYANLGKGKELRDGLSVALQIGSTLWVANDESVSLERLTLIKDGSKYKYVLHKQFSLADYLKLPVATPKNAADLDEVDIEGLDYEGGYLWLVGSHSLKRTNPTLEDGPKLAHKQLAKISADGNRYLLARIPLVEVDGSYTLMKEVTQDGKKRTAALLHGSTQGNDLTEALKGDKHLKPFLAIPGKDNGFDIEGLAVMDKRIYLGLRGPVLRGWAVILEVEPEEDVKKPSILKLKAIGPKKRLFRKHFIQLGGLGIRDLCVQGQDILILAGPTMELDGTITVFRWKNGAILQKEECIIPFEALEHVVDVPHKTGTDRAEGITLFSTDKSVPSSLLVVYDSASESRQLKANTMVADIMQLPKTSKSKKPK